MATQIIAGKYRGHPLYTPKGTTTRPSLAHLRKSLFDICQGYIEGASFLDLFSGSGAISFEALSRGAKRATLVENDRDACLAIDKNRALLDVERAAILRRQDVLEAMQGFVKGGTQFDIIFADPPYLKKGAGTLTLAQAVVKFIGKSPLLVPGGMFFLEEPDRSPLLDETMTGDLVLISERRIGRSCLRQYQKPLGEKADGLAP